MNCYEEGASSLRKTNPDRPIGRGNSPGFRRPMVTAQPPAASLYKCSLASSVNRQRHHCQRMSLASRASG
jgi:hypothetical protein